MTAKRLEHIVRVWQRRLGLESWDVKVNLHEPCHEDADATTWRSNQYERAEIRFDRDWGKWDLAFANRIVVHELVHLLARDVDEVMKPPLEHLDSRLAKTLEKIQDREMEGLVDRLAYRFVEVGGFVG